MYQNTRPAGKGHHDTQPKLSLEEHHRSLLNSLDYQLSELKPPLKDKLPQVLSLCSSLKDSEYELADLLQSHAGHSAVTNLRRKLIAFACNLSSALNSYDAATGLAPLEHQQIQAICLALSMCAPIYGARLFDASLTDTDRGKLQWLTDTLLKQAMDKGLPDGVEANGQVFDILNMVSRFLKAELISASAETKACFGKALGLIDAWTSGDQCKRLISDHNLGRCAVQIATIINAGLLDLNEVIANTSSKEQPTTQGQLLQKCVLNLCSDAVLSRLATAPIDTVSLLNICNTVKDALDKRVLHPNSPTLLPALDRLTQVIGKLPQQALAGEYNDYIALANFSNFLRKIGEYRIKQKQVFKDALSSMEAACSHLIGCIEHPDFDGAYVEGQALSNLVSFVKYIDKQRVTRSAPTSTASNPLASTSASSTSPLSTTGLSSTVTLLSRGALQNAASRLVSTLVAKGSPCLNHPKSRGGAVTGLAYLWQRNLVPHSPALQSFMVGLLRQVAPMSDCHWPYDARVILPALKLMLESGMVSVNDVWLSAQEIDRRISELGAIVEIVEALPPLPLQLAPNSTAAPQPMHRIPGDTPKAKATVPMTFASPSGSLTYRAPASGTWTDVQKGARHTTTEDFFWHMKNRMANESPESGKINEKHSAPKLVTNPSTDVINQSGKPVGERKVQHKLPPQPTSKKKTKAKNAKQQKARRAQNVTSALDHAQRALVDAILKGSGTQVDTWLESGGNWNRDRIVPVLLKLQDELLVVEDETLSAFDKFLQKFQSMRPDDGAKILVTYFEVHPPASRGIQSLLEKYHLVFDFKELNIHDRLQSFVVRACETEWNNFLETKHAENLLTTKDAEGTSLLIPLMFLNNSTGFDRLLNTPQGVAMTLETDAKGWTPLRTAISGNSPEAAEKLLTCPSANEQAQIRDSLGINALMLAARRDQISVVEKLLSLPSAQVQITAADDDGNNALLHAIGEKRFEVAKLLLAHPSAAVQAAQSGWIECNALMLVATQGSEEIVTILLSLPSKNQQALARSKSGFNALMGAAKNNHIGVVRLLLQLESADEQAMATDKGGMNALNYAIAPNHKEIIHLLLSLPSSVGQTCATDRNGMNALTKSLLYEHSGIADFLLTLPTADSQIRAVLDKGTDPLALALEHELLDIAIKLLTLPSANDQARLGQNAHGISPLMIAAHRGYTDIVKRLLSLPSANAQSVTKDELSWNAMMLASQAGHADIVGELLKLPTAETQLSARSDDGYDALTLAFQGSKTQVVPLLMKAADSIKQANIKQKKS